MSLLGFLISLLGALWLCSSKHPCATKLRRGLAAVRDGCRLAARYVRIATSSHRLDDLVNEMVRRALGCAIPGVESMYMPQTLVIGLASEDLEMWGALTRAIADETASLLTAEVKTAGMRVGGPISVSLIADPEARPGRPTVRASMGRPLGHEVSNDRRMRSTLKSPSDVEETQLMPPDWRVTS